HGQKIPFTAGQPRPVLTLHERISVESIADELGYHPDYLSHLFKETQGIGLSQFIVREKITRARNLLVYSEYSYSEIASYLGFSSQSHFGAHFKKLTGYTPRQYRETYGKMKNR
ncbi:MAG: helix-turn-helix transcriptional regulator, partial [Lachnospiraceae bacterium]|nr:helix-turn-helix transcriptional regulator [Lachnospiraceae bacterium]